MTEFPLLIKLIDANQLLSLQVHPDDNYARTVENQQGKNEMWYVAAANPGAKLILGFEKPLSKDEIKTAIEKNELLQTTKRIPVKKGDCYSVPAGLLHAICEGLIIVEVQQNSNLTYRLHDYARQHSNRNQRELHIEKAVDVLNAALQAKKSTSNLLTDWQYFKSEFITVNKDMDFYCNNESFQCLITVNGEISVSAKSENNKDEYDISLKKGETTFIPAGTGKYRLVGTADIIMVSL